MSPHLKQGLGWLMVLELVVVLVMLELGLLAGNATDDWLFWEGCCNGLEAVTEALVSILGGLEKYGKLGGGWRFL